MRVLLEVRPQSTCPGGKESGNPMRALVWTSEKVIAKSLQTARKSTGHMLSSMSVMENLMQPTQDSSRLDQRIMRVMDHDIATLVAQLCNLSLALTGSSAKGASEMALQVVEKVELLVDDMQTLRAAAQELLDTTSRHVRSGHTEDRTVIAGDESAPFDDGQRDRTV